MTEPLTRERIVLAATDLIRSGGLHALSLRRIAGDLDVSATALYAHIKGKGDLLGAVAEGHFGALIQRFESVEATDPIERCRQYCRLYVLHAVDDPELFKVLFLFQPEMGFGELNRAPGTMLNAATDAFALPAAATAEAVAAGRFGDFDPTQVNMALWIVSHGAAEVLLLGLDLPDDFQEQLIDLTIDSMLRGLTTAAGPDQR